MVQSGIGHQDFSGARRRCGSQLKPDTDIQYGILSPSPTESPVQTENTLQISYDLSPREMNRGGGWLAVRHPIVIASRCLMLAIWTTSVFLSVRSGETVLRATLLHLILPALLFESVLWLFVRFAMFISYPKSAKGFSGRHEITLSEKGLTESTAVNTTEHSWEAISGVKENSEFIFLMLSPSNGHIIPRHAFSSTAELEAFLSFIRSMTPGAA